MTHKKEDLENIIDAAAKSVREEHIDDALVSESAVRVWARISAGAAENRVIAGTEQISGCADFQSLIPAYLSKSLSDARVLLLEDHVGECLPCRRALKDQRNAASPGKETANVRHISPKPNVMQIPRRNRTRVVRWAAAAAALVCFGLAGLFVFERFDWSGRTLAATLEVSNGSVFVVTNDTDARTLAPGAQILKGERVRTAKDSTAVLKLADGSTIEMRERSEFSVSENRRGVTVALDRGDVIIEAAKQDRGRLYVQTPDSLVSVKGTIFAVESGTKGSRVSVVEGEVKVQHAGTDKTLLPGDQTTTELLEKQNVADTVGWSRNAAKYTALVAELAKLRREINERVQMPGVRYSSNLASLAPNKTVFFAAFPNLTETLAESERVMLERISQNPVLSEWWKIRTGEKKSSDELAFAQIREIGKNLGNEIVIAADSDSKGVLVLAEITNAEGLRNAAMNALTNGDADQKAAPKVRIVTDPSATDLGSNEKSNAELIVWINNDILAVSSEIGMLRDLARRQTAAETAEFANSAFYKRISDAYAEGAGILIAADIENLKTIALADKNSKTAEKDLAGLGNLGVLNLRYFVAEQKNVDGRTLSRADLTFGEKRTGIASWLARPGSMGALGFISQDASVATAFVVKEPALLVDDLVGFIETTDPEIRGRLDEIQRTQGIDIRRDFAEPLGGEFAFALDGPVLPTPSWKAVFEVYDHARLQSAIELAVARLNQISSENGGQQLVWDNSTSGPRTYYSLKSSDAGLSIHYVYADGYMIVAPTRALLDQSLSIRDAGNTLVRSERFMSAMPRDGNVNFSAIFYHDLAPLVGPLAERIQKSGGELTAEQRGALDAISANSPPTLVYAYADDNRVTIAANTDGGAFGLSPASLIGLPNSFEMENILKHAMTEGRGVSE